MRIEHRFDIETDASELFFDKRALYDPEIDPPSVLLRAETAAVPFGGREADITGPDGLIAWAEAGPDLAVRLLHAGGGVGKTRLAMRVVEQLKSNGWTAGFLREQGNVASVAPMREVLRLGEQVLVVLDYAEMRPDRVRALIEAATAEDNRRIRILLLARSASNWWSDLKQMGDAAGRILTGPATTVRHLGAIEKRDGWQDAEFVRARAAFGEILGLDVVSEAKAAQALSDNVLEIHAAALLSLSGESRSGNVLDEMLSHEVQYWSRRFSTALDLQDTGKRDRFIAQARYALGFATFYGGPERGDLNAAQDRFSDPLATPLVPTEKMTDLLAALYPNEGTRIGALRPDILGEQLCHRVLGKAEPQVLGAVFHADAGNRDLSMALETMTRLWSREPEAEPALLRATGRLRDIIEEDPERGLATHVSMRLPTSSIALADFSAFVTEKAATYVMTPEDADESERLYYILKEQVRHMLKLVGVRKLRPAETIANSITRTLSDPDLPDLPPEMLLVAHSALASVYQNVNRPADALRSADEAVAIGAANPEQDWANMGEMTARQYQMEGLLALGKTTEAAAAGERALALARALDTEGEDAFASTAAEIQITLADALSLLGQHEQAAREISEATETLRRLSERDFDSFGFIYSRALLMLGRIAAAQGDAQTAAKAEIELIKTRRELAEKFPRYRPDLGRALSNHANTLSMMGQAEAAARTAIEAVDILSEAVARDRESYLLDHTRALVNACSNLHRIGDLEQAERYGSVAIDAGRELKSTGLAEGVSLLGYAYMNTGAIFVGRDDNPGALPYFDNAVREFRSLGTKERPYVSGLAKSLINLSSAIYNSDDPRDVNETLGEAFDVLRTLILEGDRGLVSDLIQTANFAFQIHHERKDYGDMMHVIGFVTPFLLPILVETPERYANEIQWLAGNFVSFFAESEGMFDPKLIEWVVAINDAVNGRSGNAGGA